MHMVAPLFCISSASFALFPIKNRMKAKKSTVITFFGINTLSEKLLGLDPGHLFLAARAGREPCLAATRTNKRADIPVPEHGDLAYGTKRNPLWPHIADIQP